MAENSDTTNPAGGAKILAGYLAEALDMEDQINISIYKDYLNAKYWPRTLQPDISETITQYLNTLIEDTLKHRKTIAVLIEKYGKNNQVQ